MANATVVEKEKKEKNPAPTVGSIWRYKGKSLMGRRVYDNHIFEITEINGTTCIVSINVPPRQSPISGKWSTTRWRPFYRYYATRNFYRTKLWQHLQG